MNELEQIPQIKLTAMRTRNLDTHCFVGSAPLAYLAMISQADVFDQDTKKDGLQRDLSRSHATKAYSYAARPEQSERPRAFPDVVLNVRVPNLVEVRPIKNVNGCELVDLVFNVEAIREKKNRKKGIAVSRVDGNHRLYFAEGDGRRRSPVMLRTPFQIHIGLKKEQETSLFVDFNSNQKGLNTSHLETLQSRLTPEEEEIRDHLDRWIANKLTLDPESPWHGLVHMGGSKVGAREQGLTRPVNFTSLQRGVKRTLDKSTYIHNLMEAQAQYVLVRNFWTAVRHVFDEEWAQPKEHLLLRNLGVMSFSILGATVIDRCLANRKYSPQDMIKYLEQTRGTFSWHKDSRNLAGMSGNKAALIVAGSMANDLREEHGPDFGDITRNLADALTTG